MNQEIALLNAKRQLIARRITAENDYASASIEYGAAFSRMYNCPVWKQEFMIPHHIIKNHTRTHYQRQWARTDCKGFA